ncbi:MAG: T9SS type A sorting domain-containing protein, partial [Flavobacterium sp.]|nr:T9SS type A sorting domain-containing protein [Flavobacterium sp.]
LEEVVPGEDEEDEEIILYSQSVDRTSNYFTLNMFTGLQLGTTYRLRVALGFNGVFGPYGSGKDCSVTYVTAEDKAPFMKNATEKDATAGSTFAAVGYPNPYVDYFSLTIRSNSTEKVRYAIYDMAGRLLETKEVNYSELQNSSLGMAYPSGIYNVIVIQEDQTQTIRMVKK